MSFRVKLRLKHLNWQKLIDLARLHQKPAPVLPQWPRGNECVPALPSGCSVCGLPVTDAMGRHVAMGYACANPRCPSGVSSCAARFGVNTDPQSGTYLVN